MSLFSTPSALCFCRHWHQLLLFSGLLCAVYFTGLEGTLFFVSCGLIWLYVLIVLLSQRGVYNVPRSAFVLWLALLFAVFFLTLFWTPVAGYTQAMLWRQSVLFVLFVALVVSNNEETWRFLRIGLTLLALLLTLVAITQYLLGYQPRVTFLNKNSFAGFLLPLLFWNFVSFNYHNKWLNRLSWLLLFAVGITLGLVGSRGVMLAVGVGVLTLFLLSRLAQLDWSHFARRILVFLAGILFSVVMTGLDIGRGPGRLGTLGDPWSAGADRFVIWQASWEMFKDAPWHGIGVGIYALSYPPYRSLNDYSAGHFVHNDLLQIVIEGGWFAGILAVLCVASLALLVVRALRRPNCPESARTEIVILSGGLVAVSFHSLFTFNFYVYAILIVVGVLLSRMYCLLPDILGHKVRIDVNSHGYLIRYVLPLVCLIPLLLCVTGAWSQIKTQKAITALKQDDTKVVFENLHRAKRLWTVNDFNWYMEGEVVRLSLKPDSLAVENYRQLVEFSKEAYDKAFALNPLRAATSHKKGLLLNNHQNILSAQPDEVIALYEQSLAIDPGYFPARMDLADFYIRADDIARAHTVLEEGFKHFHRQVPALIPYLEMARVLRIATDDSDGAQELMNQILAIQKRWKNTK